MQTIYCRERKFLEIQAIVFDKDGTLEDSGNHLRDLGLNVADFLDQEITGVKESLLQTFGIFNELLDPGGLMAVGSRFENEIAVATNIVQQTGKNWFESRKIANLAFQQAVTVKNSRIIFPGCYELIKSLHAAGLKLAILSSARTHNIQSFIEKYRLTDFIHIIQGSDQGFSKPDPACFQVICEKLNVSCKNALMVGDSQMDIQMAKNAQAGGVIGICWGNAQSPSLEGADISIENIQEIKC